MKTAKSIQAIHYLLPAIMVFFLWAVHADAAETGGTVPERILLNITETPHTSIAVTWRTRSAAVSPRAEVVAAADLLKPDQSLKTYPARTSAVTLADQSRAYSHAAVMSDLAPRTRYAYRVGGDGAWSEWNPILTAAAEPEPFTFVFFGDIQKDVHAMCSQVFRTALRQAPDVGFWLFVGDMVNNGTDDREWADFFSALGWMPRSIVQVMAAGNHEYPDPRKVAAADRRITPLWRPHFTLPENGPEDLAETAYHFDYQGVCFVVLNGNEGLESQARWLEARLSDNPQPWIIVVIHQTVYSISERRNPMEFQEILVPLFDRFGVDLVLQGHDHGYARTRRLRNHQPVSDQDPGTVYVISNSGPKTYPISPRYAHLMEKTLSHDIWFQTVRVDDLTLAFTAYNLMQEVVDTFVIHRPRETDQN